jgi:predicted transcriptional regulator
MAKAKKAVGATATPRRRAIMIKVDDELRNELDALAVSTGKTVQQLGVEAVCDLLRKHERPVSLRDAFRQSAKGAAPPKAKRVSKKKK